jgi:hypothetical protein
MLVEIEFYGTEAQIAADLNALRRNGVPFIGVSRDRSDRLYHSSRTIIVNFKNDGSLPYHWATHVRSRDIDLVKLITQHVVGVLTR